MDFDKGLSKLLEGKKHAYYRRYSDDMIIVCTPDDAKVIKDFIEKNIEEVYKLKINKEKTEIYHLNEKLGGTYKIYKCKVTNSYTGAFNFTGFYEVNRFPISYLGFEFFGNHLYIKSSSLAKYYKTMKRSIYYHSMYALFTKRKKERTKNKKINPYIYTGSLYRNYSHFGQKIRKITPQKP
jgi:hypothetical protein